MVLLGLLGALASPVAAQTPPLSTDATLSGLELSEGRLDPAFATGTSDYTAAVGYTVTRITVSPASNDANAALEFLDGSDNALADADGSTDGFQVDLAVGVTTIKVQVTAEDGLTMNTYILTVTRTEEDTSLSPPASDPSIAFATSAVYRVTFTGDWTSLVTPGGVPGGAHFSRLVGAVHSANVTFVEGGETASAGVKLMAEVGVTTGLGAEVTAAMADALSVLTGFQQHPPDQDQSLTTTLTSDHPRVTLLSRVSPSPDWFVGVSGLLLLNSDGHWLRSHQVELYPWDAGTEDGGEFLRTNDPTVPPGVITSIRGTGKFSTEPIASLTFTLESVSTTRSVDENTEAGVNIGEPVVAPDSSGTVTYSLGGTDAASFELVPATGQLQTKAALDYEARSSYEVTITATDADGSTTTTVAIEVTNVIELTTITGPAEVTFAENGAGRVATYTASSEEDQHGVGWIVAGTDPAHFTIDAPGGALRFHIDPVAPNIFPKVPDFESPDGDGRDNEYSISLLAQVGSTFSSSFAVTVTVTDVDETGVISLSSARPSTGSALTATLTDPDMDTGTPAWAWERSAGRSAWSVIGGATGAVYVPVAADAGHYLRVRASYADRLGSGRTAQTTASNVVLARTLSGLEVATTSSREMYPAFDPEILHYAVGCIAADTLSLTLSTTDVDTRLAVNGVQYANQNPVVELTGQGGESEILITLSGGDGASTTYTLHCLAESFPTLTVTKLDGASESLMTASFGVSSGVAHIAIIDNNGVPRFRRQQTAARHFRAYPDGGYPYALSVTSGPASYVVYDANLDLVQSGISTVNLEDTNGHDFFIKSNGDYVLMAYEPAVRDMSFITERYGLTHGNGDPFGPAEDTEDAVIQVVSPTGRELLLWNSWDYMALEDCTQHRFPDDYAHINSVQVVDGDIVASFRGCSKVLRIDGTSGDVIWRLGRSNLSTEEWESRDIGPPPLQIVGDPYGEFCGQHAARLLDNGHLMLFDNGVQCLVDPRTGETERVGREFSRVVEYAIDLDHGEAIFQRHVFLHGRMDSLSYSMGQADPLDNGNWLITWGRGIRNPNPDHPPPDVSGTQANPATGVEELTVVAMSGGNVMTAGRMYPVAPVALAAEPIALTAEFPGSTYTSIFNLGATDPPQVVVAFNRPVADFDETSPSISVTGATVASVSAHVVAGEPANAYLVTLAPDGDGAISFRLDTGQACGANGGICTADGTALSEAPSALVISAPVTISFEQSTYTVTEGASRFVTVLLSSAHQGVRSVTIPVVRQQTTGSASADDLTLDESVTFEAGETRKSLALNALDDDLVEGDETATIEFGALPDGVTAGSTSTATITIADADQAQIAFTTVVTQISEGGQTQLSFEITNGVTFEVDQTINLTVGGTATAGDDFTLVDAGNQTLSDPYAVMFPAGATSAEATIRAVDDADIEHVAETITVEAWLALTNTLLGSLTITIPPSDVPDTPVVTIARGSGVVEGTDATFTLSRTASTNLPLSDPLTVSVEVTATGSTLGGSAPTTVRFEGGDATADLAVLTLDDSVVEPPGTVTALILGSTSSPPGYLTSTINSATVTVNDNDVAAFTLSASNEEVAEGAAVTVTIVADGVTFAGPQTIALTLGGTATPVDDFTLVDGGRELSDPYAVTLPAGARSVSVMIMAVTDSEDDADETIDLSVSHESSGIGSVTITITEAPIILPPVITGGGGGAPSGPVPSDVEFEWNVTRDIEELDSGHDDPTGAWSDGATLWLLENGSGADDAIYAYDLESGERVEELEFELDEANLAPRGLWSNGTTIWISDSGKEKLFAHDLASGERLPDSDLALHPDNDDTRGIWSDGSTMWVLDDRDDALFAYDLESGALLAEYALDDDNGDPRGLWSDGTSAWVSDDRANRLFAYRLPAPDAAASEDDDLELERVTGEEFTKLSAASNDSPRGIWSDGDVMYVADSSDGKVYTYNMPDAIDARLASLTLSGVDIGEFSSSQTEYEAVVADGVTETTVEAETVQSAATVAIAPADSDEDIDGYQAALDGLEEVTITVTSADESRTKVYRARFGDAAGEEQSDAACLLGAVNTGLSLVVYGGGSVEDLEACAQSRSVTALYVPHEGEYVPYILGAPGFVNEAFAALYADGLPALTPLIARSEGPPSPAPASDDAPEFGPDCLRGAIATGLSLLLYEGGSVEELDSCAQDREVSAVYALVEGEYVPYILGAPEFVNEAFAALFPEGLAAVTPLVAKSD